MDQVRSLLFNSMPTLVPMMLIQRVAFFLFLLFSPFIISFLSSFHPFFLFSLFPFYLLSLLPTFLIFFFFHFDFQITFYPFLYVYSPTYSLSFAFLQFPFFKLIIDINEISFSPFTDLIFSFCHSLQKAK